MPTADSWRERGIVLAGAAAVPLISILPFLIEAPDDTLHATGQNSGVPGFGGLSVFVQPELTRFWATLEGVPPDGSALNLRLVDWQREIVSVAVLAATALLWRRRVGALEAASYIWLVTFVVNPNFAYQYVVWGLPFFIAAGYLERTAVLQLAILPAMLWLYWRPGLDADGWSYLVAIQVVWLGWW